MTGSCEQIVGPEPLAPEYFDALVSMLNRVFRPNSERSMPTDYPYFFRRANFGNLYICRAGEKVVSHVGLLPTVASFYGHPVAVGMIGAVGTDPDYRGRGLATRTLRTVFERFRESGGHILMISGGRGLYLRNGAAPAGSFARYVLPLEGLEAGPVEVERCTVEHAPTLAALHVGKGFRFVVPLEAWRLNIEANRCQGYPSSFWLARRGGEPVAYFSLPLEAEGSEPCPVSEWGGHMADVVAGLARVAAQVGCKEAAFRLYPHELAERRALEEAGARLEGTVQMQGTIRVVDFEGLMRALSGYLCEVLGSDVAGQLEFCTSDKETYCIRRGREEVKVSGAGTLAQLLFAEGVAALPGGMTQGPLRDTLEELLPLPVPQYDMMFA